MKPPCTASCDQRAMLELAIGLAITALSVDQCPFERDGGLYDGVHVDVFDEDCPGKSERSYINACKSCIREYLEEAIQSDPAIVVGGDVSWVVKGTPTGTPTA